MGVDLVGEGGGGVAMVFPGGFEVSVTGTDVAVAPLLIGVPTAVGVGPVYA